MENSEGENNNDVLEWQNKSDDADVDEDFPRFV